MRLNRGFTLTELLLVVMILSIVAAVAIPDFANQESQALNISVMEVSHALYFSRSKALQTGMPYGVRFSADLKHIQVFRLDTSTPLPTETYDVYHPVKKSLYDVDLSALVFANTVSLDGDFVYQGSATSYRAVAFNLRGEPISPIDLKPLSNGVTTITDQGVSRTVTLNPVTGEPQSS